MCLVPKGWKSNWPLYFNRVINLLKCEMRLEIAKTARSYYSKQTQMWIKRDGTLDRWENNSSHNYSYPHRLTIDYDSGRFITVSFGGRATVIAYFILRPFYGNMKNGSSTMFKTRADLEWQKPRRTRQSTVSSDLDSIYFNGSELNVPQFRTRRSSIPDTISSAVTQCGVKNNSFMVFREDDIQSYTNRYIL